MRSTTAVGLVLAVAIAGSLIAYVWPDDAPDANVGAPAGDRPNPLGPKETTTTSAPSERPTIPYFTLPPNTTTPGGLPYCMVQIAQMEIGDMIPIEATGVVNGLGQPSRYVVEECLWVDGPRPDDLRVSEGGCGHLTNALLTSAKPLTGETDWGVRTIPTVRQSATIFVASFHWTPYEYLSIAVDESAGVITGGYSTGGDGSRGSGQQWSIGAGEVEYTFLREKDTTEFVREKWGRGTLSDPIEFAAFIFKVEWKGESIENWTGQKAVGQVTVECTYLLAVHMLDSYE